MKKMYLIILSTILLLNSCGIEKQDDKIINGDIQENINIEETSKIKANIDNTKQEIKKPNILLVIADDMGLDASPWYSEYTGKKPLTPVLDSLANDGLVFDNVWSNPLCSPTRATILTGKYGVHTGVMGALSKSDQGIPTSEYSIQQLIADKSPEKYNQAVIGKWHLATDNNGGDNNPAIMGVPYYSGYISGTLKDYFSWKKTTNGISKTSTTYATTDFTDESISWLDDGENTPWFLWLAYTAPHAPFHLPPSDLLSDETNKKLNNLNENDNKDLEYYLAAIEAMDTEIGRLLDNLPKEERENTIIVFIGDNGTPAQVTQLPFEKGESKGSISRGGVHVPMIISGAGVESGRSETFVNTSDLYTTIAELTGISLSEYGNSISFAPVIFGENRQVEREYLYAEISSPNKNGGPSNKNGWTVRGKGYQFISLDTGTEKLFADSDLSQDNNLINTYSDIASQLREKGLSIRENTPSHDYGMYPNNEDDIVCGDFTDSLADRIEHSINNNLEEKIKNTSKLDLSFNIVDTGVIDSYSDNALISKVTEGQDFYGQDSNYIINSPSYTNNNDKTITDNITGLTWQQDMGEKMTYQEALEYVKTLNLGGNNDWRIPDIKELYSLIQFTGKVQGEKAISSFIDEDYFIQPLGNTSNGEREIDAQTWSSTEYVGKTMNSDETVFGVNFVDGRIKGYPKYNPRTKSSNKMYFRLVRGNPDYGINSFTDNNNDTITDNASGLVWMKNDSQKGLDWRESLDYCENIDYAGNSDWRLPNAKELQSIVDYTRSPQTTNSAAINPIFSISTINDPEGNNNYPAYWSSTTHLDGKTPEAGAVYVSFGEAQGQMNGKLMDVHGAGAQRSDPKSGNISDYPSYFGPQGDVRYVYNYVRCVSNSEAIISIGTVVPESGEVEFIDNISNDKDIKTEVSSNNQNGDKPVKAIEECENKNIGDNCSFTSPKRSVTGTCNMNPNFGKLCSTNK